MKTLLLALPLLFCSLHGLQKRHSFSEYVEFSNIPPETGITNFQSYRQFAIGCMHSSFEAGLYAGYRMHEIGLSDTNFDRCLDYFKSNRADLIVEMLNVSQ